MCLGVPGQILQIDATVPELPLGRVSFAGVVQEVCLAYTPEAQVGDWVLVHVGFSISRLDEAEATQLFDYLKQIEELTREQAPSSQR